MHLRAVCSTSKRRKQGVPLLRTLLRCFKASGQYGMNYRGCMGRSSCFSIPLNEATTGFRLMVFGLLAKIQAFTAMRRTTSGYRLPPMTLQFAAAADSTSSSCTQQQDDGVAGWVYGLVVATQLAKH